jgi:hypothetical protein
VTDITDSLRPLVAAAATDAVLDPADARADDRLAGPRDPAGGSR